MSLALHSRIAVVTGAEQPLGRGLALALGRASAAIALLGDREALAPLVSDLDADAVPVAGLEADLSDRDATQAAFDEVAEALGPVDIVLHAAVPPVALEPVDFVDVDDARFSAVWEASMRAAIFVLQSAYEQMAGRGGRIVLVTPTVSMSGAARATAYTAAIEAQRVLVKAAARQWGPDGITLNCLAVAPEHVAIGVESTAVSLAPPALGRIGDPEHDLGPLAVFLASDAAHFVTGATVCADGGVWMAP